MMDGGVLGQDAIRRHFVVTVSTTRTIPAPPSVVWDVLTDVERWAAWCTVLRHRGGELVEGARPRLHLDPPEGRAYDFSPVVTVRRPPTELEWLGSTGLPRVFDGRHRFVLEPDGDGTRLTNAETFSGLLTPLMTRAMMDVGEVERGFEVLNDQIAARVGSLGGRPSTPSLDPLARPPRCRPPSPPLTRR